MLIEYCLLFTIFIHLNIQNQYIHNFDHEILSKLTFAAFSFKFLNNIHIANDCKYENFRAPWEFPRYNMLETVKKNFM